MKETYFLSQNFSNPNEKKPTENLKKEKNGAVDIVEFKACLRDIL